MSQEKFPFSCKPATHREFRAKGQLPHSIWRVDLCQPFLLFNGGIVRKSWGQAQRSSAGLGKRFFSKISASMWKKLYLKQQQQKKLIQRHHFKGGGLKFYVKFSTIIYLSFLYCRGLIITPRECGWLINVRCLHSEELPAPVSLPLISLDLTAMIIG